MQIVQKETRHLTSMKIFINKANESWIVDRFRQEWIDSNSISFTSRPAKADIIWIIAPWTWQKLNKKILKLKKVVCTIHHIDFNKFDDVEKRNFYKREEYIDYYHAISEKTEKQLLQITNKPIITMPFWGNENLFFEITDKTKLRKKYNIEESSYLLGSFQRDTEGSDLKSPKLSKGPDRFIKIASEMYKSNSSLKVLLTGKRRNFIINNLEELGIPYYYFDMVSFKELNELYNCLDLYLVTSRIEGGPAAIMECALSKTPIVSTDVGIAKEILHEQSIFALEEVQKAKPELNTAYNNSLKYTIPEYFSLFNKIFFANNEN